MDSGYYRNPVMLKAALETTTPVEKGSLIVSQDANITYYLQ
jgi:putative lipoprotein